MTSMRIAMIGLRGLPARAGGVERHVEELATRLVDRGHEVTVFCRPGYAPEAGETYRGIKLAQLPTVKATRRRGVRAQRPERVRARSATGSTWRTSTPSVRACSPR